MNIAQALEEAIEFAEQDFQALTPAGEAMVHRWRTALSPATDTARPLNSGEVEAKFDQWWKSSKYRQVIFASESDRQIALDAWRAAISSAPSTPDGWEVAYTVRHTDGEFCASSTSLSDAQHYALVYGQDGPVEILEVRTRPLPTPPAGGSDA